MDRDFEPELGDSTHNFTPSTATKIFIALTSVELAKNIMEKKLNYFSKFDYMSQLRQLRSQFSSTSTYSASRCSSVYTSKIGYCLHTVFTVADAEGNDLNLDIKIGSQLCQHMAYQMKFGNGEVSRTKLESIFVEDKETKINSLAMQIFDLFEGDNLGITKNAELDSIVTEISNIITPKLAEYNDKIKKKVKEALVTLYKIN